MTNCATTCICRCGQTGCGCHEGVVSRRAPASSPATLCGDCQTPKRRFGTSVEMCPDCDFARCQNPDCRKVVTELSWTVCPHCGTRP